MAPLSRKPEVRRRICVSAMTEVKYVGLSVEQAERGNGALSA